MSGQVSLDLHRRKRQIRRLWATDTERIPFGAEAASAAIPSWKGSSWLWTALEETLEMNDPVPAKNSGTSFPIERQLRGKWRQGRQRCIGPWH